MPIILGTFGDLDKFSLLNHVLLAICPLRASVSNSAQHYVVALCLGFTVCTRSQSCYLKGFFSLSPSLCLLHDSYLRGYFVCFSDLVCKQHLRAFRFGSYSFNRFKCLIICLPLVFSWSWVVSALFLFILVFKSLSCSLESGILILCRITLVTRYKGD